MSVLVPPRAPVRDDPQALIREARRRTRRRRLRAAAAVTLLGGAGVIAFFTSSTGRSQIIEQTSGRPFVNVTAFGHAGDLAFISRGTLWVLNGAAGSLRRVASTTETAQSVAAYGWNTRVSQSTPVGPADPTFSPDGRWLAYLVTTQNGEGDPSQLWLANADGTGARRVATLAVDSLVGWSPSSDVLAVIVEAKGWYADDRQGQLPIQVDLVSPHGGVRRLVALSTSPTAPRQIESAVWSPGGNQLAVSVFNAPASSVTAYPIGGGKPTTWFSIGADQHLPGGGCDNVIAALADWWPHWGIAFWAIACGASRNLDNTPLDVLTAPGAQPRQIAQTLSHGDAPFAAAANGALALVASPNAGRIYSLGKAVETCTRLTLTCRQLPGDTVWLGRPPRCPGLSCEQSGVPAPGKRGSAVSLEPAWSPNGSLLAYVLAPTTTIFPLDAWYGAHELLVWNRRTGSTRRLAAISGVSVPAWSRNGRDLLYVSGDGLWLAPAGGGRPVEIVRPLFPRSVWTQLPISVSFDGSIDWTSQFSWWSP
ncbi:MAG: hypothetical protein ABR947_10465 [Solirubrobacteraceae bacterium]